MGQCGEWGSAWVSRGRCDSVFGGYELVARGGDSASGSHVGVAFQQRAAAFSVDGSMESGDAELPVGMVEFGDMISTATGELASEILCGNVACLIQLAGNVHIISSIIRHGACILLAL